MPNITAVVFGKLIVKLCFFVIRQMKISNNQIVSIENILVQNSVFVITQCRKFLTYNFTMETITRCNVFCIFSQESDEENSNEDKKPKKPKIEEATPLTHEELVNLLNFYNIHYKNINIILDVESSQDYDGNTLERN